LGKPSVICFANATSLLEGRLFPAGDGAELPPPSVSGFAADTSPTRGEAFFKFPPPLAEYTKRAVPAVKYFDLTNRAKCGRLPNVKLFSFTFLL
jgi:hypothetical protein